MPLIALIHFLLSQEDMLQGESNSIKNQKMILQQHAENLGLRNCQFYVDDGYSGTDLTRPDYVRMIRDMEDGKIGREKPDEFYAMATKNGEAEAEKFYRTAEREKGQIEKRVKELDNIIRCLYEDRVCGRLLPERYDVMAVGYEQEQEELKEKLLYITKRIDEMDMRDQCIKEFIAKAREYVEMPKLTPELLRVFIRRIDVYEKLEKYSRTCGNPIVIHYSFQLPVQNGMPAIEPLIRPATKSA